MARRLGRVVSIEHHRAQAIAGCCANVDRAARPIHCGRAEKFLNPNQIDEVDVEALLKI